MCGDCDDDRCIGCREVGDFYVLVPTYANDDEDDY
jgi:hypothetical protein